MTGRADGWIGWTTIGCVALLAVIAGTVSYLHMHQLVAGHGQPGVGGGADAAICGRDDRGGLDRRAGRLPLWGRGGLLPCALLVAGSVASLAANGAVAEPMATGRVIAAWPSFALIGSYELLMRQIRSTEAAVGRTSQPRGIAAWPEMPPPQGRGHLPGSAALFAALQAPQVGSRELQLQAWQWAQAHQAVTARFRPARPSPASTAGMSAGGRLSGQDDPHRTAPSSSPRGTAHPEALLLCKRSRPADHWRKPKARSGGHMP
jgi:hypothetical protein